MKKQHLYALFLGMSSIFSIFYPVKTFPKLNSKIEADRENLHNDMARLLRDRIKRIAEHG